MDDRIQRGLDTFEDPTAPAEEIQFAVEDLLRTAQAWMREQTPPLGAGSAADARRVEEAVDFAYRFCDIWVDIPSCRQILQEWLALVSADADAGGLLADRLPLAALSYSDFVALVDGPHAGLAGLDDETIARIAGDDLSIYRLFWTERASLRRVCGDITGCFEDVDRWRASARSNEPTPWAEYLLSLVLLQLEIDLGRLDRADHHARRIRALVAEDPEGDLAASTDLSIAQLMAAKGLHSAARRRARAAIEAFPEEDRWTRRGKRLLGDLKLEEAAAILRAPSDSESLERADDWLRELTGPSGPIEKTRRMVAAVERADLLLRLDRPDEARALLEESAEGLRADARATVFEMRFAERRYDIAHRLGDEDLRLSARADLEGAVEGMFESWGELDLLPGGVGFLHYAGRRRTISLLVDDILSDPEGEVDDALELVLRADALASLARKVGAPAVTPAQLRSFCARSNAAVVVFLSGADKTHRFLVTGEGTRHDVCSGADELEPVLERAARVLSSPTVEATTKNGSGPLELLAREFVPEEIYRDPSRYSSVHFAGTEVIGVVPLEALVIGDDALGLTVPIAHLPSAAATLEIARRSPPRRAKEKRNVQMFALSGVEHGGIGIDFRPSEFETIAAAAGGAIERRAAKNSNAQVFLDQATSASDLFIAWSHGVVDMRETIPAGIFVLADEKSPPLRPGGPVVPEGLELLNGMRIQEHLSAAGPAAAPRVVLLAACDMGRSHARKGDPAIGDLGGIFLGVGSSAVVLSDRPIEREAAYLFVKAFARAYSGEGKAAGVAALEARRAVASRPGFEHPHYWAALQLVGWGGAR